MFEVTKLIPLIIYNIPADSYNNFPRYATFVTHGVVWLDGAHVEL